MSPGRLYGALQEPINWRTQSALWTKSSFWLSTCTHSPSGQDWWFVGWVTTVITSASFCCRHTENNYSVTHFPNKTSPVCASTYRTHFYVPFSVITTCHLENGASEAYITCQNLTVKRLKGFHSTATEHCQCLQLYKHPEKKQVYWI